MKRQCVIILSVVLLSACGAGGSGQGLEAIGTLAPVPPEHAGRTNPLGPEAATAGEEIFSTNCATCHGPEGHGDGPAGQSLEPKPKDLAVLQQAAGDDYLFWRISEGKPGTSMVAWKGILSEEQIWQIVSFIRTLK